MLLELLHSLSHIFYMALHVVSSETFPQPLSKSEEKEQFMKYHTHGDINARNKLVEHNLRLVAHIIKKYYRTVQDQEDLISVGTIGLIKAVNTFDPTKGARFSTYAARCIENEILMHFRLDKKKNKDVSISEPIKGAESDEKALTLSDIIAEDDTVIDDLALKINSEKLYKYINDVLNSREQTVIEMRFGLLGREYTQREVAAHLNISRSYVSRIENKALQKLKKCFDAEENKATFRKTKP